MNHGQNHFLHVEHETLFILFNYYDIILTNSENDSICPFTENEMGNFVKVVGVAVVDIWGGGFGGRDYQTRKKGEFLWLRLFLFSHLHTKSADIKPKCSKSLNGPKVIKKPECFFFPKICSKIVTSKIGCLPVCKAEKPLICLLSDSRITNKRGLFTSDYFQSAHSNWIQRTK